VKTLIAAVVLLALSSVPALAADESKPQPPDAKFLAAVDKAIAAAQEKAVPTPKLLKLAKVLIKKGRLIRANEVAALIARKKTDADLATAKKINTAVAGCKSIVGSWEVGPGRTRWEFTPDGKLVTHQGAVEGRWEPAGKNRYTIRMGKDRRIVEPHGLTCTMTRAEDANEKRHGKRVK